ncbi:hypothetical protein BJX65DRAFT_306223 [Aspergillus insuetus]
MTLDMGVPLPLSPVKFVGCWAALKWTDIWRNILEDISSPGVALMDTSNVVAVRALKRVPEYQILGHRNRQASPEFILPMAYRDILVVRGFVVDELKPSYEHRIYLTEAVSLHQPFKSLKSLLTPLDPAQRLPNNRPFLTRRDRLYLAANFACNVFQLHGSWRTEHIYVTNHASDAKPLLDILSLSVVPVSENTSHRTHNSDDESSLIQNPILFPLGLALAELSLCQTLDDLRITIDDDAVDTVARLKTASRNIPLVRSDSEMAYAKVVKKCLYWSETEDVNLDSVGFQEAMFHSIIKPLFDDLRVFDGCRGVSCSW